MGDQSIIFYTLLFIIVTVYLGDKFWDRWAK